MFQMTPCREKHTAARARLLPCLVEREEGSSITPGISALLWGPVSQHQPFCGLHPEPYHCKAGGRVAAAQPADAESQLAFPGGRKECWGSHVMDKTLDNESHRSIFWRSYVDRMGELLPTDIAGKIWYRCKTFDGDPASCGRAILGERDGFLHETCVYDHTNSKCNSVFGSGVQTTSAGAIKRIKCCRAHASLEPGRMGRCLWKASKQTCIGRYAGDCPVACGRCIVCTDHPLHGPYAAFYRRVKLKASTPMRMGPIIEARILGAP